MQIRGNRVELQEIDAALHKIVGHERAVSVPLYSDDAEAIADDLVAFVESGKGEGCEKKSPDQIIQSCKKILPDYMVPSSIHYIRSMPLNSNGKVDKNELRKQLIEQARKLDDNIFCARCLKTLDDDRSLGGIGLVKIMSHSRESKYICQACLMGF